MSGTDCEVESEQEELFFTIPSVEELAASIDDEQAPIAKRMRSCFLLKQLHTAEAISVLARGLHSPSILLGHECAYVLGQMQDTLALPFLTAALCDSSQHPIVRHECAEALANIDADESLPLLLHYCHDPSVEVAETCSIAADKMTQARSSRQQQQHTAEDEGPASKYASVDPAPPLASRSVDSLRLALTDGRLSMYERYRAMFSLRNLGTEAAIDALAASLQSSTSAVFRHEIAYVMGADAAPGRSALSAGSAGRPQRACHGTARGGRGHWQHSGGRQRGSAGLVCERCGRGCDREGECAGGP